MPAPISLHACIRCGGPTEKPTDLKFENGQIIKINSCEACRSFGNALLQRLKPVRAALDAADIPAHLASKAIIDIWDALYGSIDARAD